MARTVLVVDKTDSLHRALAKAAPGLRSRLAACHQTARASAEIAGGGVAVLVAGPACLTPGGLRFLHQARRRRPDLVTVLVTDADTPDVPVRELVRTGASDIVAYPCSAKALRAALERAVEMADGVHGAAVHGDAVGKVFTVTSPSGGSGKTFLATNLAYELAARSGRRVALVDLDLQFGEVNTALRLRPQYTIHDLLEGPEGNAGNAGDAGDADLRRRLPDFMTPHAGGFDVLAAPTDPALADSVSAPEVNVIVQALKETYDYVVVDTPAALTEAVLAALDLSETLVVMATLDLPSVRNLSVFLSTLERLKIPREAISLVLNKAERDVGLSPAEVRRGLGEDFHGVLPYAKEVSRAFNTGQPVLQSARHTGIGRALSATFQALVPGEPTLAGGPGPEPAAARPGPFTRLRARFAAA